MLVKIMTTVTLGVALLATGCGLAIWLVGENGGNPKPHIVLGGVLLACLLATTVTAWVKG